MSCKRDSSAAGTRAVATHIVGAPSSAPGERIAKKFVVSDCQSTWRTFITSASTRTPWTSNAIVPPTVTRRFFAISSSSETRGRARASSGVHHRPSRTVLPAGGASAVVSAYSRMRKNGSSPLRSARRRSTTARVIACAPIAASRARTTGTSVGVTPVVSRTSRSNAAR